MNSLAEYILYFYLIVFLSMLGFDVVSIFYRKMNAKKMHILEEKVRSWINKEGEEVTYRHIKLLEGKLKKISYFLAFSHVIEEMEAEAQERYLKEIREVFFSICSKYQNAEVVRQTYFIYFLTKHPYIYAEAKNNSIIQFLLNCTTSSSVYLRENALNALQRTGKVAYIKEAFLQMNYFNVNHHYKLVTDGLLRFSGNFEELRDMLISELDNYNENFKVATINYFSYKKIDCKEAILKILKEEKELKEVRIACIRYFAAVFYQEALEVLYDLLKDDKKNWEYAAIAASSLKKYPCQKTIDNLEKSIQSHNWYVRNNAAASLILVTTRNELELIYNKLEDKYAKEALDYALYLKGE